MIIITFHVKVLRILFWNKYNVLVRNNRWNETQISINKLIIPSEIKVCQNCAQILACIKGLVKNLDLSPLPIHPNLKFLRVWSRYQHCQVILRHSKSLKITGTNWALWRTLWSGKILLTTLIKKNLFRYQSSSHGKITQPEKSRMLSFNVCYKIRDVSTFLDVKLYIVNG
jgi:hypothetical protein